ncbi:protein NRT1/ PTR FAMILY 8.2-like [Triticum aestivum]|uniref:protein NRT1/ PTR FAMILY 8.2-like n=1 Tax=Triticum aestivum TaxID=4565 RepID=UPI001D0351C7|nr:protein NRT1/ PTR FAMILY 8.2-like [Triticum aestivum]
MVQCRGLVFLAMPLDDAGDTKCLAPTPVGTLRAASCRLLCPEGVLGGDVLRVALAPLCHGSLVLLGDEEAALQPDVVCTVLVRDQTRRRAARCACSRVKMSQKFIYDGGLCKRHAAASYARAASFLDKAALERAGDKGRPASPWRLCTVTQVEEIKCVLRLLPVWACGIIFAAVYTQVSTTFILQGDTLDPRIGSFCVPAAVLTVFDTLSVMLWVPLYDRAIVPLARHLTGHRRGFTQLTRMGIGFVILTVATGMLEVARRRVVTCNGTYRGTDGAEYVSLSIFWQVPHYVLLGAAEVFTFIGQMEFFYDQAPDAMRSICSGLASAALALGNYASSALVSVVVCVTTSTGRPGWIPDDINHGHLDYFFGCSPCSASAISAVDLHVMLQRNCASNGTSY